MGGVCVFELTEVIEREMAKLAEVAGFLWERGWAESNGGNITVNLSDVARASRDAVDGAEHVALEGDYSALAGQFFASTGTMTRMREVARDWRMNAVIVRVDDEGKGYHIVWRGDDAKRPTSELFSHLGVHQAAQEAGRNSRAVVHTHPDELMVVTHIAEFNEEKRLSALLLGMAPEMVVYLHEGVALIPYELTGTTRLMAATAARVAEHSVYVWEKHGAVAIGDDVLEAFDLIDVANKAAKMLLQCRGAGVYPEGLTKAQIAELRVKFFGS